MFARGSEVDQRMKEIQNTEMKLVLFTSTSIQPESRPVNQAVAQKTQIWSSF